MKQLLAAFLLASVCASCLSTQVQVKDVCVDCSALFGSCQQCSERAAETYECDRCTDGFYLMKKETDSGISTLCVSDCADFAYNYVNNKNIMKCEFCGDSCYQCSAKQGCLADTYVNHGQKFTNTYPVGGLFSESSPSAIFSVATPCADPRCDICQKYDNVFGNSTYKVCDSCYMYVNNYPLSKQSVLNCALCDPVGIDNCNTCDPDRPANCAECKKGYWLQSTNILVNGQIRVKTICLPCTLSTGCKRCDSANLCLECDTGYQLTQSGTCHACDLSYFNSQYSQITKRCSVCTSTDPTECKYCDVGFFGSYTNPSQCELKCDIGQYPKVTYTTVNGNENVIESTTCEACHLSCENCSGPGASNCTSCALNTQYLKITNQTTQSGTCVDRTVGTGDEKFDIFVAATVPANARALLNQTTIGSPLNPFWDLDFALIRAQELAVSYLSSVTINIYLLKGDHFVIQDKGDTELVYQSVQSQPKDNLNFKLTLQPLPCSYTGNLDGIILEDVCSNGQLTVYNKKRELFVIEVPQSLTVSNVRIDALDSVLHSSPAACLNLRQQCCQIQNDILKSLDGSESCEKAMAAYLQSEESKCLVTVPRSLFRMSLNILQEVTAPNRLSLTNVVITNFYYALHSLISFTPIWGNVSITSSQFSQLNICGAVLKNKFVASSPDVLGSINYNYMSERSKQALNPIMPKYFSNPASQVCSQDCFSITIEQVTVSKVPFLARSVEQYTLVAQENGVQFQGYFMTLDDFKGPVSIAASFFTQNRVPYTTCQPITPAVRQSLNNFQQLHNPLSDFDKIQQSQLITILNHADTVTIQSSTFTQNVMTSGLILIESTGTTSIAQNSFIKNQAVVNANVMIVRQCSGLTISANLFTLNAGCPTTALLSLQCISDAFSYDRSWATFTLKDGQSPLAGSSISVSENTYTGNLVGKDKSLVSIEGFHTVSLNQETYKENENYLPQTFHQLSSLLLSSPPASVQSLDNYEFKAKSMLKVSCSAKLILTQGTFNNNWVADHQSYTNDYQSHGLVVQDLVGTLIVSSLIFSGNHGISGNQELPNEQSGIRSGLFVLQNCTVAKMEFNQVTFSYNSVYRDLSQSGYVVPALLSLSKDQITSHLLINSLVITSNTFTNTDYGVWMNLMSVTLSKLSVTYNTGSNIIIFDLPTDEVADQYIVDSQSVISQNILTDGSVFLIREAKNIVFSSPDSKADEEAPLITKILFKNVLFSFNLMTGDLGTTSCISVSKTKNRSYTWLSMKLESVTFNSNTGTKTAAVYVADSMIAWFIMTQSSFSVTSSLVQDFNRLAQFVYWNNPNSYLQIDSSTFNCQLSYDASQIMFYTGAQGRPSLFRINDYTSSSVRLSQLQLNSTSDDGTLDSSTFRNNFTNNFYQSCNQVDRGAVFYLEHGARLVDTSSSFSGLSAIEGGVAYVDGDGSYLTIQKADIVKTIYAYYGALVFVINGGTAEITNGITIYSPAIAYEGTIAYLTNRGRLLMTDQIVITRASASKTAMISAINGAQFWLEDVTFTNCKAEYQSAIINIENGREQYHLVNGQTQINYGEDNHLWSYMHDCTITLSQSVQQGRLISVTNGALFLNNTNFVDNKEINVDNFGIEVFSSELQVYNCSFWGRSNGALNNIIYQKDLQEITGAFIAAYSVSTVKIELTEFSFARGSQGGCAAFLGSSNVTIKDSSFSNCAAMIGGAIYAAAFDNILISNTTFTNNIAYQGYGQNIYAVDGTSSFYVQDSKLQSYQNSIYVSSTQITILSTSFTQQQAPKSVKSLSNGGGVFIDFALQIQILKSNFTNLLAQNGGAVYFKQNPDNTNIALQARYPQIAEQLIFFESNFVNCSAVVDGGAIYLEDIKYGQITQSNFFKSKAGDSGGAVYFYCTPMSVVEQQKQAVPCSIMLNTLLFTSCAAQTGGAIFWNFVEPKVFQQPGQSQSQLLVQWKNTQWTYRSLTFANCEASSYGPQIAGAVQELVQISNMTYQQYYNQSSLKRQNILKMSDRLNYTANNSLFQNYVYSDVQSGGEVPPTWFALVDKYGQVVSSNSGNQITFRLESKQSVDSIFPTFFEGTQDFYSMFGVFEMSHIGIVSAPDINIKASIIVNAVDIRVPSTRSYLQSRLQELEPNTNLTSNNQYRVMVTLMVRNCIIGEGLLPSGACFTCQQGSYLLTIPTVPTECVICQIEKSICLGGSDIGPLPGFWRKSNETYNFLPCKEQTQCVGKDVNLPQHFPGNAVGLCAVELGYYGVLCSACLPGFKRQGPFSCAACSPYEIYYTIGAFTLMIIALSWLINSTISGAQASNNTHSVFQKILMNHLQMLMITSSFDMNWPTEVLQIFQIAAPIQQITSSITSFDCYMDRRDPKTVDPYYFYVGDYELRIIYMKLCIMAFLPIFLCLVSYSVWYIILRCKGRLNEIQTKFVATIVLLLFLVHPSITQTMIDMFNCQDFDGENRLVVDLQVSCYQDLHPYFAWYLALPCLIVWGLGIPLVVFVMMRKDSDKLDTVAVKQKFGFLFNGYKRHNYYWEIIIMYRKILCIFIAVFLNQVGIIVQALVLLIVLVLFLQANSQNRPFAERALNDIEAFSLATQIVTIYSGIFFISAKNPSQASFDPNKDFALTSGGSMVLFLVIAFCNVAFILLWLVKFIVVVKVLIKESYPTIYIILFLCGRKDKMALETAKRARDTKKEAIIESIEAVTLMMNKMKGMYSNNVFYQDHNRFLRLIYYIESERQQIDLTEKRHNYYIQGAMARHRRFDPEIVKEANDERPIQVNNADIFAPQMSELTRYKNNNKSAFKIRQTSISKIQPDQEEQGFIHFKHNESGNGVDLLEAEHDSVILMPQEKQQPKKRKRKKDQQNLQAFYLNSRNAAVALKSDKISHIRAADVSPIDGQRIEIDLPEYLKGFKDSYASDGEEFKSDHTKTQEQFHDKLHLMRKLTQRINEFQDSPQKKPEQFLSQKTQISQSQGEDNQTVIDLKPYGELETREVTVTRGNGGDGQQQQFVPEQEPVRLREPGGKRHELLGEQVVEVNPNMLQVEDLLMVTIMDEANQFVQKSTKRGFKNDNLSFTSKVVGAGTLPDINAHVVNAVNQDKTESFNTDPSMRDYDDQQEERKVELNFYPQRKQAADEFPQPKEETNKEPMMGEGLIKGPNFHPNLSPSIIFDDSQQQMSDDLEDSQRILIPPDLQLGQRNENRDKSRN